MRSLLAAAFLLALAGCAADGNPGSMITGTISQPFPTGYRQLVQDHVKKAFKDPYSIRDAEIAEPQPSGGPILLPNGTFAEVWVVCVRANAKNSFGAYDGISAMAFLIHNNAVGNVLENLAWESWCSSAKYQPFPEINQRPGAA